MLKPDTMPVRHIAALAKLSLTAEEEARLDADMAEILQFVQHLQRIDTLDVPLTRHIVPLENVMRADEVQPSLLRDTILTAAPSSDGAFITVPKALEEGGAACPSQE